MVETRSQRQAYLQRPPYPHLTTGQSASAPPSATHSVFQSSSSLSSISSLSSNAGPHNQQISPSMLQQQAPFASAPLPSPSTSSQQQMHGYFGSISQQGHMGGPTSHPQAHYAAQQRLPGGGHMQTGGGAYLGQRGGDGGGTPETAPFLKDFNLVAEAAKRAQMACLTRDLGDVGL